MNPIAIYAPMFVLLATAILISGTFWTVATILGRHPQYKFYCNHFLADSPRSVADRHYVTPSDEEFFAALEWFRGQIAGVGPEHG